MADDKPATGEQQNIIDLQSVNKERCPYGHHFGQDRDRYEECENCTLWVYCTADYCNAVPEGIPEAAAPNIGPSDYEEYRNSPYSRERRLRVRLLKQGYELVKSRSREHYDEGRYIIIQPSTNAVVTPVLLGLVEAEEWSAGVPLAADAVERDRREARVRRRLAKNGYMLNKSRSGPSYACYYVTTDGMHIVRIGVRDPQEALSLDEAEKWAATAAPAATVNPDAEEQNRVRRRITAYHEAGHMMAYLVLGRVFKHGAAYPKPRPSRDWLGLEDGSVITADDEKHISGIEQAIISLAGPAAEARYTGSPLASVYLRGGALDLVRAQLEFEGFTQAAAEQLARQVIDETWPQVERLAALLLTQPRVDYPTAVTAVGDIDPALRERLRGG